MTHPHTDTHHIDTHLSRALEHARRLAQPRPEGYTEDWTAHAAQVGDLSVLLLALRS